MLYQLSYFRHNREKINRLGKFCKLFFRKKANQAKKLFHPVGYASPCQVIGRKLDLDIVPRQDTDIEFAHLAGDMGKNLVTVLQFDPEHGIWQGLLHNAINFD